MFNGRQVVKPDELENSKDKSRFKALNGKITEQERDVAKWWKKKNIKVRLALFGLENQTIPDPKICFRLYGYDGAAYKSQYEEERQYPVITLVLYFNHVRHWKGAKTLFEGMEVSDEIKPFVNDYKMNLFEIAWLTEEQVKMFRSDFRIVADYYVQLRKNKNYIPNPDTIKHVDAIMKLMTALTGDSRFEDTVNNTPADERRKITMCKVLDDAEKRGKEIGKKIGKEIGKEIGEKIGIFKMITKTVNDYVVKHKLTQKAACEDLSIDYKEYLKAKRYMKKIEAEG